MPRIAITLGDPRGIGPEVVRKALASDRTDTDWLLIGPNGCGLDVHESVGDWRSGASTADAGRLAGLAITKAVELAKAGQVSGIVTAPIDKAALLAGGFPYPGHTEMLAELVGVPVAMMLASERLRVVLATTHIPLRDVPACLTADVLERSVAVTRAGLERWYGLANPRIALCAINPHAGDGGRFGDDDQRLIEPLATRLGVTGPVPADTVFVRAMRGEFDAVIAPYHDVGMTAIKVASFGSAVNVTLGLPFPRTSPDHGTALDIAGQDIASATSMSAAMREARRIVDVLSPTRGSRRATPS